MDINPLIPVAIFSANQDKQNSKSETDLWEVKPCSPFHSQMCRSVYYTQICKFGAESNQF